MGLTTKAKGLDSSLEGYDCGYLTFGVFRIHLSKVYNKELGELYEKWYRGYALDDMELKQLEEGFPRGLAIFLFHPDCEGDFSVKECREIYNDIKDLNLDMTGHNYSVFDDNGNIVTYNMLDRWKNIFKHCIKRGVKLYFV